MLAVKRSDKRVVSALLADPLLDPPLEAVARVAVDARSASRPWEQPKAVARLAERPQP